MQIGFGKVNITPRVGVELCGFGPYVNRHSIGVRDPLFARAIAFKQGGQTAVLVSCDLVGIHRDYTARIRQKVTAATGVPAEAIMVHSTHTHSGPNTGGYVGWGDTDAPYIEIFPGKVADACIQAVKNLVPAELFHAEVPCEGMSYNREYENDDVPAADRFFPGPKALNEKWRPRRAELTDTTCHVFRVDSAGKTIGFFSYFGCHPVVCAESTRYIHGDYCGVASHLLEREMPGVVGFFLQGAQGDVNSAWVHQPEQESMLALDVFAARYARAVRRGLEEAQPLPVDSIAIQQKNVMFTYKSWGEAKLQSLLDEQEKITRAPGADDAAYEVRIATVYATNLRRLIADLKAGRSIIPPTELQGFRIGKLLLLGSPYETFRAIKNDICTAVGQPLTLVLSFVDDSQGYAIDKTQAERRGYAADTVPLIIGQLPFERIHEEMVAEMTALAKQLL